MATKNTGDLRAAIATVFNADSTTSTGLRGMTGKSSVISRWGDRGEHKRPFIVFSVPISPRRTGTSEGYRMQVRFSVFVGANSTGLEDRIADRIDVLLATTTAFSTLGLDVAFYEGPRTELPELDEGRNRLDLDYEAVFTRST